MRLQVSSSIKSAVRLAGGSSFRTTVRLSRGVSGDVRAGTSLNVSSGSGAISVSHSFSACIHTHSVVAVQPLAIQNNTAR